MNGLDLCPLILLNFDGETKNVLPSFKVLLKQKYLVSKNMFII